MGEGWNGGEAKWMAGGSEVGNGEGRKRAKKRRRGNEGWLEREGGNEGSGERGGVKRMQVKEKEE